MLFKQHSQENIFFYKYYFNMLITFFVKIWFVLILEEVNFKMMIILNNIQLIIIFLKNSFLENIFTC